MSKKKYKTNTWFLKSPIALKTILVECRECGKEFGVMRKVHLKKDKLVGKLPEYCNDCYKIRKKESDKRGYGRKKRRLSRTIGKKFSNFIDGIKEK